MAKLFFSLFLVVASCASITKARHSNLSSVKVGQSQQEIVSILGNPNKQIKKGKTELWLYDIYADDSSHVYPYNAKFENGILTAFDADSSRNAEDEALREKRRNSNQQVIDYTNTNVSPPLKDGTPSPNGR